MKIGKYSKLFLTVLPFLGLTGVLWAIGVFDAQGVTVENPLEVSTVDEVATRVQQYLIRLVGGIAIVFIVLSGILYIIGGSIGSEDMISWAKKGFFGAIIGLVIILGAGMMLYELYYIVGGESLDINALSAKEILQRLISFLLAIVGLLFLIATIIGGIWYFTAGADESKMELGKKTFTYSLIGLTIALAALILIRQIAGIIGGDSGGGEQQTQQEQGSQPTTSPIIDNFQ